ncbi:MAG: carboxypeptidase regulatory-like domain-containing protein [Planctomycetes bacterium]|nr:carboxypeptidase regulatory-like domain-containing protein [Planctomycetota bacterium]
MTRPQDKHWLDKAIENTAPGTQPEPDFKTWQQQHPQALASLQQRAQKSTRSRTDLSTVIELGRRIMKSPITKLAIAAVFVVGCLFLARYLKGGDNPSMRQPNIVKQVEPVETQDDELALAQTLYEQKDLPGLLNLLDTGQAATQLTIAEFLAEIGDESVIPSLQRLADTRGTTDLQAVIQTSILSIQTRLNLVGPNDVNALPSLDPNVQVNQEVRRPDKGLLLTLLDAESHQPAQGVPVKVTYRYDQAQNKEEMLTANKTGQCRFTWDGDEPDSLYIRVLSPAHVYKILEWNPGRFGIPIPASYTSHLNRGVTIGGAVKTEAGEPIEDVAVSVGSSIRGAHQTERDTTFSSLRQARTDAQGQWVYDHFPANGAPHVTVEHPSYVSTKHTVWSASMEAFLDRTCVVLMHPGLTLTGRVVDTLGLPVEGVEVLLAWSWTDKDNQTTTDSEG